MDHFSGRDLSVKETSVCIVDDTGRIVREVKVASEPEALLTVLRNPAYHFKRIGLEAGPLSQWLFGALAEAGLPENREYPRKFGSHPGNPRLNSVWNMTGACALFQFEDRTFITMERAMTQQAPKPKQDPKPGPGKPGPGGR